MPRPAARWGKAVCLDCREEVVGLCETCTKVRVAHVLAYQATRRDEIKANRAYQREQRARKRGEG